MDLSVLGSRDPIPLIHAGQGRHTAQPQITPSQNGVYWIPLLITKPAQAPEFYAAIRLDIFPAGDVGVFEELAWRANSRVTPMLATFEGREALALASESSGIWRLSLAAETPVQLFGFEGLSFAFHPATHILPEGRDPILQVGRTNLLEKVDLHLRQWQTIDLDIEELGLPNPVALRDLAFSGNLEGTFYLADFRLLAQEPPADPGPTAVWEHLQDATPTDFTLEQNYPNPFNSSTVIRYSLPHSDSVEITVYNLFGQPVATLVSGMRPAGAYVARWNGRNDRGTALAGGVYLVRLQAGARVQTRKLLLLQ